jgi:hypothetical protein
VRGLDGIDAEWVTEKEYLKEDAKVDRKMSATDANIVKMDHLETVMVSMWSSRTAGKKFLTLLCIALRSWWYVRSLWFNYSPKFHSHIPPKPGAYFWGSISACCVEFLDNSRLKLLLS